MITKKGKNYYKFSEVSQMTGVHLMTLYKRAKREGVDIIKHEGFRYISEDSFDIIKKRGTPGRKVDN